MRTRFIALGCVVVFVIVLVVLGGAALFAASIPPVSQCRPITAYYLPSTAV